MRYAVLALVLVVGIAGAGLAPGSVLGDEPPPIERYVAHLDGAGVDPPVETTAQGEAILSWDGVELSMKLVTAIIKPDTIRLHVLDGADETVLEFEYDRVGNRVIDGEPWTKLDIADPQDVVDAIKDPDKRLFLNVWRADEAAVLIRGEFEAARSYQE